MSLIVPARDAAGTLVPLLQDLHAQRYPKDLLEVLVVDDHSSDGTAMTVRGMMRAWPQLRLITSTGEGKKAAIAQGVAEARGEWMVLTDADARCSPLRVAHIMHKVQVAGPDMLILPVETIGESGFIQRVQADEQTALLGVAAGTALGGAPVLVNGANMAFSKAAFMAVGGYEGDHWASGDDIFLMRRMLKARRNVRYLLDPEVVVSVKAEPMFGAFWRQRLRWAGKMRGVGGAGGWAALAGMLLPWFLLYVSCSFNLNEMMVQRPIACVLLLASAWMLWLLPVLALTRAVRRFLHTADDHRPVRGADFSTFVSLVAFTVYAPIIAVVSLFIRPKWKGRRT
ncbi:MAG: glycosyltransferase [Flavobacteriales bacterium]|nr:glycosyltransferase [Flavobacteriales bacterium]MBK6892498.1 glycosyltransferase [Flavobacteriales bacterium]MBK7286823.1 glycosyltransferase [Flavobacteriales bacterium]HRA18364.1 glycosyltransferase [Flavobacteriales bacterium]